MNNQGLVKYEDIDEYYAPKVGSHFVNQPIQYNLFPQNIVYLPVQESQLQPQNIYLQSFSHPSQHRQYHQQYSETYGNHSPLFMPFDIAQQQTHIPHHVIQNKIRKLHMKLDQFRFSCYKVIVLIFSIFSAITTIAYFLALFNVHHHEMFPRFMDLIFSGWQWYQFFTAYTAVSKRQLDLAKTVVNSLKWFMILYAIINLGLTFYYPSSINPYVEIYDPDFDGAPERSQLGAKVTSLILSEIIFGLMLCQAFKFKKILEKLHNYHQQMIQI